jgi:arginine utilization regulatory protein
VNGMLEPFLNNKIVSSVFDYLNDGVQIINKTGHLVYCNKKAAMLDDISIDMAIGQHIFEIYPSLD